MSGDRCSLCGDLTRGGRCCADHDRLVCSACRGTDRWMDAHRCDDCGAIASHHAACPYLWNREPMGGRCSWCNRMVDSFDPDHRVTSVVRGGRGVECVPRGDIAPADGGPLRGIWP